MHLLWAGLGESEKGCNYTVLDLARASHLVLYAYETERERNADWRKQLAEVNRRLLEQKEEIEQWGSVFKELEFLRERNARLEEALDFFDNKIYIMERAPLNELSDRYRIEIMKLRKEIEHTKQVLAENEAKA